MSKGDTEREKKRAENGNSHIPIRVDLEPIRHPGIGIREELAVGESDGSGRGGIDIVDVAGRRKRGGKGVG